MGRDFKYEFYVFQDDSLNAFALPGGKVFVSTGTILACNSEAEFAGLLAHEISHAVLSHGLQKLVKANLLAKLSQVIPLGNLFSSVMSSEYSLESERQSDMVSTRVIASAGYAADGLHNLMVRLLEQKRQSTFPYLSIHPATPERVSYLEKLIQRNGYNRYAFEGLEKHAAIQKLLKQLLGA